MALIATRTERSKFTGFPDAPELGSTLAGGSLEVDYWDHPSHEFALMLAKRLVVIDQEGQVVWREVVEWEYEGIITENQVPVRMHRVLEAWAWLPGVSERGGLVKVSEEWTRNTLATIWVGGPTKSTTRKEGYVIYDRLPEKYNPADVAAAAAARGKRGPDAPDDVIPESAREYIAAVKSSAIVEKASAGQVANWQLISLVWTDVQADLLRVVTTIYTYDNLTGMLTADGPTEVRKDVLFQIPLPLEAPELRAFGSPTGITVEIRGGGGVVQHVWPFAGEEVLKPDAYALYRRTVTDPGNPPPTNRYGLLAVNPVEAYAPVPKAEDTAVTDYAGDPASTLPPAVSYEEPDDATPPVAESWELIAEPENAENTPGMPGRAMVIDTGVEPGGVYEYKAVARVGDTDSPESAPVQASAGNSTSGGGLSVATRGTQADVVLDDYGETVVVEVPALPPVEDLTRDIAIRQAIADKDRDGLRLTPPAPLFMLERGQLARVAEIAWTTWGRGLKIVSRLVGTTWRIEGWGFEATRNKDGSFTLKVDPIEMDET